ncbi:MAG: threonine synthase [Verrucomicrobia bacterium]|nr:MAG: threonine synthase [Verrucomicrobiota bacterium]
MKIPFLHDRGVINRYRQYLPVTEKTPVVSLSEGSTPLIYSPWLSDAVGRDAQVYLKYEGLNPTGSFKDRGMTVAVSKALERGAQHIICASTGNTSAAAAAYAARAQLSCAVLLPHGKIATGKLLQAFLYGAKMICLRGNFDDALRLVRQFSENPEIEIVNSINPFRIEGQKTAAFEVVDLLGDAPDLHLLPVGNAGNITAYWRGYKEYHAAGKCRTLPRMVGLQAYGSAPLVLKQIVEEPDTIASAIRIGNPASWQPALAAIDESAGFVETVTDAEIVTAQVQLASKEGVFVEPASAAPIAGLLKHFRKSAEDRHRTLLREGSRIVCTVTGHGLKDPNTPAAIGMKLIESEPTLESLYRILEIQ